MPINSKYPAKANQDSNDLLILIRQLGQDLRMRPEQLRRLHLDSRFDKDLGLDSLTRMEMLTRIEEYYSLSFPEQVYGRIESARDLWREIQNVKPSQSLKPVLSNINHNQQHDIEAIAYDAETLVDVLEWHVKHHPQRTHITFYTDQNDGQKITFQDLKSSAETMAAGLQYFGLKPKQAVAIMLPTSREYFISFFAILIAGGVPVPLYPPARRAQIEEHLQRHQRILQNCQAIMLITVAEDKAIADRLVSQLNSLQRVVTADQLAKTDGVLLRPEISAQDIAFLQYTSGSTGTPKGVVLTHQNLLSNVYAMGERVAAKSTDVYVSWLPLYHDMGLIGAWFGSLYYSMHFVVMSPLSFLARPSRWLNALHQYHGTLTGAPNFAYELCLQRIKGDMLNNLDLSSVRCMFNGAEPVSPATLIRFSEKFEPCGLSKSAIQAVYGLAECSVGLAFSKLGRTPLIDQIDRLTFMKTGLADPVSQGIDALKFACCGIPLTGHEIRVVDGSGRELPERQQGRLEFKGPSTTSGYFRNPSQSQLLFHGDWLDSGDLAYIANGELYITGRVKDLIIHAGRNIYPHELEYAIGALAGIRNGCVAVFGSQNRDSGTERLIVLAESKIQNPELREQLHSQINSIATALVGTPVDDIVFAAPHTVLKTSSGKIRRTSCRELYQRGLFGSSYTQKIKLLFSALLFRSGLHKIKPGFSLIGPRLYGAYAWLIFIISAVITWPLVVCCPRRWSWSIMRSSFRLLSWLCHIKVTVQGLENINPEQGPFVFVCNHASYLDSMMLILTIPMEFNFVAKAELNHQFIAGTLLRKLQTEFVERFDSQQSISDAKKITAVVAKDKSILFFPEGTFTREPGLLPFRMGAFSAAVMNARPIIPITIRGTRSILRAHTWLPRRGAVIVNIAKVMIPEPIAQTVNQHDSWNAAIKLADAARQQILMNNGEPDCSDV